MVLIPAQIIGTGHYIPEKTLENNQLAKKFDITEEWIYSRTGIKSRHIADEHHNTSDIGLYAALEAIKEANIETKEIDMIIFCTLTPDMLCPATACILQSHLNAYNAACFDLEAACAGFIFGLSTAYQYIATGMYKTILVVGADLLSRVTDYEDKSTSILFGDGAGAVVVRACEENSFMSFVLGSAGSLHQMIHIPSSGTNKSSLSPFLNIKGKDVFKWAIKTVPDIILSSVERAGISLAEVDYFIIHQANERITMAIADRLGFPKEKFLSNIADCGNTSAASIPILLSQSFKNKIILKGPKILMIGFGSGV